MHIKYVKLENIRSYVNEKIDFPTGSVLLCGDIGSGKSTILLAIEFALFGIKRGSFSGSSLLRNGTKKGSVEIKFSVKSGEVEKEVIINRVLKRTPTSVKQEAGFMSVNGERKEGTPVELRSWVLDLLGYPNVLLSKSKDLIYRYTVYTPQEEMKHILFSDKEERLDTLRRVFNIDKYKRVRENLNIIIKQIRDKSNELEGRIHTLPEKTKQYKEVIKNANDLTREVKALVPKIKDLNSEMDISKKELESVQGDFVKLREFKQKSESKKKEIASLEIQKKSLLLDKAKMEAFIKKITYKMNSLKVKDIDENFVNLKEKELETLNTSVNDMKNSNVLVNEKIKSLKEQISLLSKETKSKRESEKLVLEKRQELKNIYVVINQKKELEKNIEKIEKIIEVLHNKITEMGVKYATSERNITQISDLSDCPTCHQKVTDTYKKTIIRSERETVKELKLLKIDNETNLKAYDDRIKKTKENLKNVFEKEKDFERVKAELESLDNSFKEFDVKKKQIYELERKIGFFEQKFIPVEDIRVKMALFKEQKAEFKELQTAYSRVREKKVLMESLNDKKETLSEVELKIRALNENKAVFFEELSQFEIQIKSLFESENKLRLVKTKIEKLQIEEKRISVDRAALMSKRESLIIQKDNFEKEIIIMRSYKDKMFYLIELKSWLSDYFAKLTLTIEKNIMMRVYGEFNELFREWFNMMIEDEILNVRLDDEFTPVVEQNGYEVSLDDLSGGEKTSCALAYRLALNRVINDCIDTIRTNDIIILDEPTDGFSSEQLDRLKEVIDEIKIGQIIIVSHESKIESFVDNIIRINKAEHISSVVS